MQTSVFEKFVFTEKLGKSWLNVITRYGEILVEQQDNENRTFVVAATRELLERKV